MLNEFPGERIGRVCDDRFYRERAVLPQKVNPRLNVAAVHVRAVPQEHFRGPEEPIRFA